MLNILQPSRNSNVICKFSLCVWSDHLHSLGGGDIFDKKQCLQPWLKTLHKSQWTSKISNWYWHLLDQHTIDNERSDFDNNHLCWMQQKQFISFDCSKFFICKMDSVMVSIINQITLQLSITLLENHSNSIVSLKIENWDEILDVRKIITVACTIAIAQIAIQARRRMDVTAQSLAVLNVMKQFVKVAGARGRINICSTWNVELPIW